MVKLKVTECSENKKNVLHEVLVKEKKERYKATLFFYLFGRVTPSPPLSLSLSCLSFFIVELTRLCLTSNKMTGKTSGGK